MFFILSKKLFLFSRYSIFPFLSTISIFKRTNEGGIIYDVMNLLIKEFLACVGCFALFTKIERGLGLAFGAQFLHRFSRKMLLI